MGKVLPEEQNLIPNWRRDVHAVKKYQFLYHFLPHPDKKIRATLLSTKAFLLYCLVVISALGLFKILPPVLPNILGYAANINEYELLKDTNKKRVDLGLKPLKVNTLLVNAAEEKARHMFKNNYWAHIAPDGTEPWDFIIGEDYDYIYAGENLAKNFSNSTDVVEAWYNSPSHKENLLNPNYTEVGFAIVDGTLSGYETTLVVQMFGKPRLPTQLADANAVGDSNVGTETGMEPVSIPSNVSKAAIELKTQKPLINVRTASNALVSAFGALVVTLFILDVWYSSKRGIIKLNGHTLAHLSFLLFALLSIWFVLKPGTII